MTQQLVGYQPFRAYQQLNKNPITQRKEEITVYEPYNNPERYPTYESAYQDITTAYGGKFSKTFKIEAVYKDIPEPEPMGIKDKLKSIFLPTPEVAAQRRKDVFGTESKTVAAGAILATAATALTPIGILKKGVITAGKALGSAFVAKPLKTSAVVIGTSAVVAGGGLKLIPPAFTAVKKSTETVVGIAQGEKPFTPSDLKDVGKVGGALLGVGIAGTALGAGAAYLLDKKEEVKDIPLDTSLSALPTSAVTGAVVSSPEETSITPITAETQVISPGRKTKKKQKVIQSIPSVKVNVLNQLKQTTNVGNRKFINYSAFRG